MPVTGFVGIASAINSLRLGNEQGQNKYLNGTLDEVRIWNIVRTLNELDNNKFIELTLPQPDLVAYYKFNEGIANGNNSTETTLIDEIGSNNGSLVNFSLTSTTSNWVGENTLSILNNESTEKFTLFPNPSKKFIQVSGLAENENYEVYNTLGAKIKSGSISNDKQIDIRDFTNGLYFLKFENVNTINSLFNNSDFKLGLRTRLG